MPRPAESGLRASLAPQAPALFLRAIVLSRKYVVGGWNPPFGARGAVMLTLLRLWHAGESSEYLCTLASGPRETPEYHKAISILAWITNQLKAIFGRCFHLARRSVSLCPSTCVCCRPIFKNELS